jgi:hypothetical protein
VCEHLGSYCQQENGSLRQNKILLLHLDSKDKTPLMEYHETSVVGMTCKQEKFARANTPGCK